MRDIAYIALGSNLGDREEYLERARSALAALPGTRLLRASSVEETAPVGEVPQGPYLNQMVAIETELAPRALLDRLHEIASDIMGNTICAFGEGTAMPMLGFLKKFRRELEDHVRTNGKSSTGQLAL